MKKLVLASLSVVALASCTQDYECTCTVTQTNNGDTDISTEKTTLIGVTKAQMENDARCISYDQTYTSNSGNVSNYKQDCTSAKK